MSLKLALLFCLLAIASARRPHLGFRFPGHSSVGRIVGGVEAKKGEFPHQLSLQTGNPPNLVHLCGGSILNNEWILTAARCVIDVEDIDMYFIAGKHLITKTEKSEQLRQVVKFFIHENYTGPVGPYDIALGKLEKPLVFNEYVQLIALPKKGSDVDGIVVLSGWGSNHPSGFGSPDVLQKAELPIVDVKTCKEAVDSTTIGVAQVLPSHVCTGPLTGGVSVCSGDFGGPLIKVQQIGIKELVGIVSWGVNPCGTDGAPSVYTRVSSFIDWIENIVA